MHGARGVPLPAPPEAQQERQRPDPPVFRAAVTRVEVNALVLDRDGKPLRGLTAADFEVLEDGVPQIIWEDTGAPVEGAAAAQFVLSLEGVGTPASELTVDGSHGRLRTTVGVVIANSPAGR